MSRKRTIVPGRGSRPILVERRPLVAKAPPQPNPKSAPICQPAPQPSIAADIAWRLADRPLRFPSVMIASANGRGDA